MLWMEVKKKCMFHINGCMNIVWNSLNLYVSCYSDFICAHIYDCFIIVLLTDISKNKLSSHS